MTLQFVSDWHQGMSLPMKRSKKLKLTWGPQTNRCPKEACTIEVGFSMEALRHSIMNLLFLYLSFGVRGFDPAEVPFGKAFKEVSCWF